MNVRKVLCKMTNEGERVTIPLRSGDEAVFVTSSHLLDNVNELIDLLRSEQVKLDIWLQLAVTYYQQQKFDQFLQILKTAATQSNYYIQFIKIIFCNF